MNKEKTILLTGATGLVGSYLLKLLLGKGNKVFCLARSRKDKTADERIKDILAFWDKDVLTKHTNNLAVIEADIAKESLGIDNRIRDLLKSEIDEIYHCAAVTEFNWPLKEIRKVNTEGTKKVLDLAAESRKLKKVNHISTAYVCGNYKGVFSEKDLDVGQKFNTTYEQSKFEAEKIVEEYRRKGLWIDVFRPPLVIGESSTGKTLSFRQNLYQLFHMWNREIFKYFPAQGVSVNIVFVDELSEGICRLSSNAWNENKNYHPFGYQRVFLEDMLDTASKILYFSKPEFVSPSQFFKTNPTPVQKIIVRRNIFVFNADVGLDSQWTNALLKKYDFQFSNFNEPAFLKLLDYCLSVKFLKKYDHMSH